MCSGSEAGSYVRLIDFVYHLTLGLRVIKKKKEDRVRRAVPSSTAATADATLGSSSAREREMISDDLLRRNVQQFRGGLVFKADRLVYHSTLGSRVIKKKKRRRLVDMEGIGPPGTTRTSAWSTGIRNSETDRQWEAEPQSSDHRRASSQT